MLEKLDPSSLTAEQLRTELLAHSVELPAGTPTKDVFVRLYLEQLSAQDHAAAEPGPDVFSSDEEPPVPAQRRSSRRSRAKRAEKHVEGEAADTSETGDVTEDLLAHRAGEEPVTGESTCVDDEQPPDSQVTPNGQSHLYSDQEDEPGAEPVAEPEAASVVEQAGRGHAHSSQQKVDELTAADQNPDVDDALNKLIDVPMTAICRRPIRGAAGRPLIPSALSDSKSSILTSVTSKTSGTSITESHAFNSVSSCSGPSGSRLCAAPSVNRSPRATWRKLGLIGLGFVFLFVVYLKM